MTTTTPTTTRSRMAALLELGQSIWLDYLRRGMIRSGELAGLVDAGLRGMTSNPTIFEQGIAEDDDYDEALARLATSGMVTSEPVLTSSRHASTIARRVRVFWFARPSAIPLAVVMAGSGISC